MAHSMNEFIIKTMSGDLIKISHEEYQGLLGKQGLVFIKSLGEAINTSRIERIMPLHIYQDQEKRKRLENRAKSNSGVLHTGEKAIYYFGRWYLDDGFTDEKGKPDKVLDPTYYPEVARDCLPTPEEFAIDYEHLLPKARLKKMVGSVVDSTRYLKEPTKMKNVLEETWERVDKIHFSFLLVLLNIL